MKYKNIRRNRRYRKIWRWKCRSWDSRREKRRK